MLVIEWELASLYWWHTVTREVKSRFDIGIQFFVLRMSPSKTSRTELKAYLCVVYRKNSLNKVRACTASASVIQPKGSFRSCRSTQSYPLTSAGARRAGASQVVSLVPDSGLCPPSMQALSCAMHYSGARPKSSLSATLWTHTHTHTQCRDKEDWNGWEK